MLWYAHSIRLTNLWPVYCIGSYGSFIILLFSPDNIDINECAQGTHRCEQKCRNTAGSYTCSCNSGYTLESDGQSCTATTSTTCGGQLVTAVGSFQTPGWPNNYPREDFQCEWTIHFPYNGYAVQFTIDSSASFAYSLCILACHNFSEYIIKFYRS